MPNDKSKSDSSMELKKAQVNISKSLVGLSMSAKLFKSLLEHHSVFKSANLAGLEGLAKVMSIQSKFAIPQETINAIASISQHNEKLLGGMRAITEALKIQSPALAQFNSLQFALRVISEHIATIAAHQKNWSIIDDFEELTEQSIEFSESLSEEITEEQQKQFQVLLSLVFAFVKKHKQKGIYAFRFLEVVLVFYAYYSIFSTKPELADKEDIRQINLKQDSLVYYINLLNEQLREANEYRITNRVCEVKLKPNTKTLTLYKLPKDYELIVIQIHHKWVYVSYYDPKDKLPQTGWILKKYLDKPE